jgi:hypothetical protein
MMSRKAVTAVWSDLSPGKRRALRIAASMLLGGIGGFAYYWFVGCSTGTCPITSNPWISTAWGAGIGGLMGNT